MSSSEYQNTSWVAVLCILANTASCPMPEEKNFTCRHLLLLLFRGVSSRFNKIAWTTLACISDVRLRLQRKAVREGHMWLANTIWSGHLPAHAF
ncbi:hypothetical protein B0T12DRAFT_423953 [Alternaria alternata]|nr:hypothetical protein B0T12DRAFT_423953 [Alternaria alternata]